MNDFKCLQNNSLEHATCMIIGVGASTGGLNALQELLRSLNDAQDMAIVFVQHPEKDNDELLIEFIAKATTYDVVSITSRKKLKSRTVYVCPPWTLLEVKNGFLRTIVNEKGDRPSAPIDYFLQSLAENQGECSVGVILSGAGSDGTLGLKAISDAGGLTFAQTPDSAEHDSMPRSAATTGIADHVLSPREIAIELKRYATYLVEKADHLAQDATKAIHDAIPTIARRLFDVTNHNFQHYKQNTLVRRIQRRMRILKLTSVGDYLNYLDEAADEPHALFRELLISVTAFFRDPDAFEVLTESVMAPLFANRQAEDTVRIWVPGCATGEEAYTLAMLCREQMDKLPVAPEVQIFATDIDERALKISRQATYPIGVEEHISPERLKRFFIKRGKKYQITKEIRELVLFSAHNLISDPPFSRLDLISCRNLLIYLGPHLQQKLIPLFHYSLNSPGYLMLGPSENVSAHGDLFRVIDTKHRISQRKDTSVDLADLLPRENEGSSVGQVNRPVTSVSDTAEDLMNIMQRIVLDEFSPKSVIVDEVGKILCASADMHKYLTVGTGIFQNNIIKMARSGLKIGLRAALHEAKANRRRIDHDDLSVQFDDKLQRVMLTVQPMPRVGQDDELFMVVFHDSGLPLEHNIGNDPSNSHFVRMNVEENQTQPIIAQLERELSSTRDDLEKTFQEMETANEELKASNEELLSMNEELQSVIEELASSKEEIRTASVAVGQANSDLENLLQNTRIATIFVDSNGIIRRFTPTATEIYNLIASDVGRSLGNITHNLDDMPAIPDPSLLESSVGPIEHEVRSESGRWYLRRVLPNIRDTKIDGVILSFIDITDRKQTEIRLDTENRIAKIIAIADSFDNAISDILRAIRGSLNAQVCSLWLPDHKSQNLYCAEICVDSENAKLQKFIARSQASTFEPGIGLPGRVWKSGDTHWIENLSLDPNFSRHEAAQESGLITGIAFPIVVGSKLYAVLELFTAVRMEREQALLDMLHSIGADLGQFILRNKLDENLRDEEARKSSILEASIDAIVTMDDEGHVVDFNPAAEKTFGFTKDEIRGQLLSNCIIPEEYRQAHAEGLKRFLRTKASNVIGRRLELTALRKDGSTFPIELAINATQTRDCAPFFTAHMRDITERKNYLRRIVDSERQIRSLISSTAEGIYGIDLDGNCVFANETCAKLLGYASERELSGKQMHHLIHHSRADGTPYPAHECRIYSAYLDCERVHVDDEVFWRKDGSSFEVEYWSYPQVQDGEVVGCVVTFLDITQRRIAETERERREAQLNLAMTAGKLGAFQWDIETDKVTWSDQLYEIYGCSKEEFVGTSEAFLALLHPDDRKSVNIKSELDSGATRHDMEFRAIRPVDGKVVWMHSLGLINRDHNGNPQSITGVASDITERKQRELTLVFLADLHDQLLRLNSEDEIVRLACELTCEFMGLSHVLIGQANEDASMVTIVHDQCSETELDLRGLYSLRDYMTEDERNRLSTGQPIVINDTSAPSRAQYVAANFASLNVGAIINATSKGGPKLHFMLSAIKRKPHNWREDEIHLVCDVANTLRLKLDRARAESALLKSETRFRDLADNISQFAWMADAEGSVFWYNQRWFDYTGTTLEEMKGWGWLRVHHTDHVDRVVRRMQRAWDTGELWEDTFPLKSKDGEFRWFLSRAQPIRDESGNILRWFGTNTDITEAKEAESALRASKEQLQLGVEVADLALAQIDYQKGTVSLSPEAATLYGLGEGESVVTRDQIHNTFHPDERQSIFDRISECLNPQSGGRISLNHRIVLTSGEVRWLEVSKHVLFDHTVNPVRPISGILAAHDITESKEQEQRIRESEERLRNAAEAAGFGTVHADLVRNTISYSIEMKRLLGLDINADEQITPGEIPEWVHTEDRTAYAQHFLALRGLPDGTSSKIDHRIVRPNGEVRWVRLHVKPVYSQIGERREVTQLIGTIVDFTQQHEFEQSLNEARAIAEAANESKSVFLANMSHEIRTPMTAILGYTDLVADRIQDEQAAAHLRTIRRNGYYLLDIINDILDLSKIEAGMLDIDRERFSPKVLVEDVRSIMEVRAKEKQLILEVENHGLIPTQIESDPKRLKQILINLLGNAIKFTESGTVKLAILYADSMLQFQVIDTGVGMSKAQQNRLFQPFSQGDHTVNRQFGGTGLGLVISQRLAALLGGAITVKSESKKGSTFTATIATGIVTDFENVQPYSVIEPLDQVPALIEVQLNCNILVVDDRRDIRFLSKRFLSEVGAIVTEAEDGELALLAVSNASAVGQVFDLILLDMQMPKLDGYETARRLRQLCYSGPIIALTADAMQGDMKRCLECGCNNYLSKPIDRALLLRMVHDYISGART